MAQKQKEIKRPINKTDNVDRVALAVSDFLGSIWFLSSFLFFIVIYMVWNSRIFPGLPKFDRSPFDVLDTILSVFAIILSISVLISQRRQRRMEKIREEVEFEVNIRAEHEITKILEMLHEIQVKIGINKTDSDLEEMKKELDLNKLHNEVSKKTNPKNK